MNQKLQKEMQKRRWRRLALLFMVILPLVTGLVLWILSIEGLIVNPSPNIFGAIFTAIGAVLTAIGIVVMPPPGKHQSSAGTSLKQPSASTLREHLPTIYPETVNLGVSRRKGALLVLVPRELSGAAINLCQGFDKDDSCVDMASHVVLRRVDGSLTFVAIFPALQPGKYTVSVPSTGQRTNETIQAGIVSEIDWRRHVGISKRRLW